MASMTAQFAVGHSDRYHGGIRPTHVLWLSENDRPGWILEETWSDLYGEPTGGHNDEESPPWTQQSICWIPSAPQHILQDGILLIAIHVLCGEAVLELARERAPDLLESNWLDLTKIPRDTLAQLREGCLDIELDYKLVVTVLGGSSLEKQLPVLERYAMQIEVCTVTYSAIWGGFVGPSEAEVRGSLTASWSGEGPTPDRYRAVNFPSFVPGALAEDPTARSPSLRSKRRAPVVRNPWLDLPDRPPYVLPEDRAHVETFNRCLGRKHREQQLDLKLVPEPFLGPRGAPLVVLMLNPGLVDADYDLHRSKYRSFLRANLGDDAECQRHLGLRSEFVDERPWWRDRFAKVLGAGHDPDELSRKVLSVEFHGYHARRWRSIPVTLPSQRFGFQVVETAIDRGATIITTRGKDVWEVAVPRLRDYERVVPTRSPRAAYVSPGNLGHAGFERVLQALE